MTSVLLCFGTMPRDFRLGKLSDFLHVYKAIAKLINNFLNWLYEHVDELSEQPTR